MAECLQVLADVYLKATEAPLLIPGDFEAETAHGNVVEIYPRTKDEGGEPG